MVIGSMPRKNVRKPQVRAYALFASLALACACNSRPTEAETTPPPASSSPGPKGIDPQKGPIYQVDTTTQEVEAVFLNHPPNFRLIARLSAGPAKKNQDARTGPLLRTQNEETVDLKGIREIVIQDGDKDVSVCGRKDWYVGTTAVAESIGPFFAHEILVCNNRLKGAPINGGPPSPTSGLEIECFYKGAHAWDFQPGVVVAGDEGPSWLVEVKNPVLGGVGWAFEVIYYLKKDGHVMGKPSCGDGMFRRKIVGGKMESPELIKKAEQGPALCGE